MASWPHGVWAETSAPASTEPERLARVTDDPGTVVQVTPSGDVAAASCPRPGDLEVDGGGAGQTGDLGGVHPGAVRSWTTMPFPGWPDARRRRARGRGGPHHQAVLRPGAGGAGCHLPGDGAVGGQRLPDIVSASAVPQMSLPRRSPTRGAAGRLTAGRGRRPDVTAAPGRPGRLGRRGRVLPGGDDGVEGHGRPGALVVRGHGQSTQQWPGQGQHLDRTGDEGPGDAVGRREGLVVGGAWYRGGVPGSLAHRAARCRRQQLVR